MNITTFGTFCDVLFHQILLILNFVRKHQLQKKKSIPKYKCNVNFIDKPLDFINTSRILCSKKIIDSCLDIFEQDDIPLVIYTLSQAISNIFDYYKFAKDLNIIFFIENPNTAPCSIHKLDQQTY